MAYLPLKREQETLAKSLERFWHEKGYGNARFSVELKEFLITNEAGYSRKKSSYEIVSNLVNGVPPQ